MNKNQPKLFHLSYGAESWDWIILASNEKQAIKQLCAVCSDVEDPELIDVHECSSNVVEISSRIIID